MYWALLCPFLLRSIAALVINELENWNIPVVKELIDNPERDFLDVDVNSDFLDTSVSIKTVYEPPPASESTFNFLDYKGNNFRCQLTYPTNQLPIIRDPNFETIKQTLLNKAKSCYYFKTATWIYEYCHMKSARQVNRNKINGVHYEIPIGRYYPPHNSLKPVLELNYVKVTFDDGKYCPLKGAPRMSHIKFVCADKSKDAMYLVDVVEAPICEYNFIVHVPELCGYLGQYTTAVKRSAKVTCYSESVKEKVGKTAKTPSSSSKSKTPIVGLDNILDLIEKKYKDSSLLLQYKDLVRKAFEQLKADDLSRKLEDETESLSELIKLLFPKDKEQPESEVDAEVEDLKARGK